MHEKASRSTPANTHAGADVESGKHKCVRGIRDRIPDVESGKHSATWNQASTSVCAQSTQHLE
jgi:hypothetical protein